jgi:uncharacterized integral membrane protein
MGSEIAWTIGGMWLVSTAALVIIAIYYKTEIVALFKAKLFKVGGSNEISKSTVVIGVWILAFGLFGLAGIAVWSVSFSAAGHQLSTFGANILVALASAAVGSLLGFLFGIPRTLDPASRVAVAAAADRAGSAASSQAALAANTNLERISDWLTTLLIGATLVQTGQVITWVGGLEVASGLERSPTRALFRLSWCISLHYRF